jgi:hypothetical protein
MKPVQLEDQEWQTVVNLLATKGTWIEVNSILNKLTQQLQPPIMRGGNSHAIEEGRPESGEREHQGVVSSRESPPFTSADYRDR